ncbi:hypothetical protein EV178_004350 [Coemansia sp. RSA 1646]|nr:hypothetical protein EV178_004350 [Coemansia sp. RSA 1646]
MEKFRVSHQLVSLDFNFDKRVVKGITELSVEPKTRIVKSVNIDGYSCEFKHNAPTTRQGLLKKTLRIQNDNTDAGELAVSVPSQIQITPIGDNNTVSADAGDASVQEKDEQEQKEPAFKILKLRIEFYMVNPTCGLVFGTSDADDRVTTVHTETNIYPSTTRSWVPCLDSMHERSTWDLFFSVPACTGSLADPSSLLPLVVVSAGELSSLVIHPQDPSKRIFRYIMSTATPACTLGFAIGPFTSACTLDGSQLSGDENTNGDVQTEKTNGTAAASKANEEEGEGNNGAADTAAGATTEDRPNAGGDDSEGTENLAGRANHNSKLRKATVDAIGGVYAFTHAGFQDELENTCEFIPEALAFHSQEFGSYPYATYKVVFMDGLREPIITCASLTIASTDFLHPRTIIEQVYDTRRCLGLAIAQQWFGTYIIPETWSDYWLVVALAGYIASLFVRHNLGENEHRYRLKRDMTRLCHADVNQRPISYPNQAPVVRQDEVEFVQLKAPIILYMLDRRMMKGGMSLGLHRIVPKILVAAMSGDLGLSNAVGTSWFLKMCRKVSGVDFKQFSDQWIFGTGCPVFHFGYAFNRKKLVVEITMHQESTNSKATAPWVKPRQLFDGQMTARIREADGTPYEHVLDIHEPWKKFEVQFNTKYKRIRRSTKRFHMRQMAAAAEELNVNAEMLGIEDDDEAYSNIALFGAENEQEKRDWRVVEWGEDDEESLASATFEWIRIDSDMEWACIIHFEQPDFMWAAQLQKDRDVAAQLEAVDALQHLPSSAASTTLMRTVMDARVFYRVRVDAALALERFAKASLDWIGLHHLIKIYKNRYCLPPQSSLADESNQGDSEDISVARLPRPNNFANIGEYFTQKAILGALSNIRDANNEAPAAARKVMVGALKYNDNSENVYSDCYFLSNLIHALSNSIIHSKRFGRVFSMTAAPQDDDAVLGEIERLRKLDMLVPSYHNVVTCGCMEALLRLSLVQRRERLFNTALFFSMATADAYVAVREVAVGGLMMHWGLADHDGGRFFAAIACDARGSPRLAAATSRYLMELTMVRAMVYGRQHRSLLFMEEKGKEATEYIDTDARLVGGLESFIDALPDSDELQTLLASSVYDSTLAAQNTHVLLGALNMLVYQTADCSVPPRVPKTRKKLKIKLGGKRKTSSQLVARSNASSDSEDMPLALSMTGAPHRHLGPVAAGGGYSIPEDDPFSADMIPGEFGDVSEMPLIGSIDSHGLGKRKWQEPADGGFAVGSHSSNQPPYSMPLPPPPIGGTRPPPINLITDGSRQRSPSQEHGAPPLPPVKVKLKLKLSAKTPSAPSNTSQSQRHYHHFSPTMSPPLIHSTVPRVSSPLAAGAAHSGSPSAWSPAYNPPDVYPANDFSVAGERKRADSYPDIHNDNTGLSAGGNDGNGSGRIQEEEKKSKTKRPRTSAGISRSKSSQRPVEEGLSAAMRKQLARVLRKVSKHPSAFPFMRPVDVALDGCPTYYDVIKHPMDLGTIKMKLESPAGRYANAGEFEADVQLMLSNCFAFNPAGTPVHLMGRDVEAAFDKEWAKVSSVAAADGGGSGGGGANDQETPPPKGEKRKANNNKRKPSLPASNATVPESSAAQLSEKEGGRGSSSASRSSVSGSAKKRSRKNNSNGAEEDVGIAGSLDDPDAIMEYLDKTEERPTQEDPSLAILVERNKKPAAAAGSQPAGQLPPPPQLPTKGLADWKATCNRILLRLQAQPSALEFLAPVDPIRQGVPTYPLIVKTPMDLGTVRKQLDRNIYTSVNEFRRDVNLVLANCFLFNKPGTFVHAQGEQLQSVFASVWKQHMGSTEDPSADLPDDITPPYAEVHMGDAEAVDRARTVLNKLKRDPNGWPFLKPVDPVALGIPTYFDIVKNPMDLSTIQKKITKKTYKWAADFVADIQLIVDDCFLFNPPDTPVNECGKALQKSAHDLLEPYGWSQWLAAPPLQ